MSYQIVTDSSCDLPLELMDELNIRMVPFYVTFDEVNYLKDKVEQSTNEFYRKMIDNKKVFPKSSLPSVQDYVDVFTEYADKGIDIICLCITTKFSGSYNSARNAAMILSESHPDIKITVVDTIVNTVLQGILVREVARMRDAGVSYSDALACIERIKPTGRIIFTVGNLDYLKKGGRIGKVLLAAATALGVKPLIILKEGEIFGGGITRNRGKSLQMVIDATRKHFKESGENPCDYEFVVGYGIELDEAKAFKENVVAQLGEELGVTDIPIYQIGSAISVHTGPYPLGIAFVKKYNA